MDLKMRVGVPRCLSYYYLSPLYLTFLREIGAQIVESPHTSEKDLDNLCLCPTDEPCVSVKVAFSHAGRLIDEGVDALFVPAVISLSESAYSCPKMMGLPAMLRSGLELDPARIISPVINMKEQPDGWQRSWVTAARAMGCRKPRAAMAALEAGLAAWHADEDRAVERAAGREEPCDSLGARPTPAASRVTGSAGSMAPETRDQTGLSGKRGLRTPVTAVMGHAYLLRDVFAEKVVEEASRRGPVALAEMVSTADAERELGSIRDGLKVWTIEGRILGASLYLLRRQLVDRLVFVSAFSCGPASVIENYIEREAHAQGIPYLNIAVDEHTGEAGLLTRMEAFLDLAGPPARRIWAGHNSDVMATSRLNRSRTDPPPGPIGLVNMGNLDVPVETVFSALGVETVPAPKLTDDIVALGKEMSPEFMCYPMVTLMGQVLAHARRGIKKTVMIEGKGPCRLGWYVQVMQEILDKNSVDVTIYGIDSPFPLKTNGAAAMDFVKAVMGPVDYGRAFHAAGLTLAKLYAVDKAVAILRRLRAWEEERGAGDRLFKVFREELASASATREVAAVFRRFSDGARRAPTVDAEPLHIQIAGEVYVVNEPFVNKDVEKVLGSMDRRVWVHRSLDVSSWINCHILKTPGAVAEYRRVTAAARPYLPFSVGGHGQESIGETVAAKRRGYDGVLHLFPFTCMPEIIAQNVLVKVSKDLDIPVLSIMISEQTGVAGFTTRLEAFCDLLDERRYRKSGGGTA